MDNKTTHKSINSKKYLKLLDLTPALPLLNQCYSVWPHYDQVIKNRKHCIYNRVIENILTDDISQIIIFASGMDSLGIEIASNMPQTTIYEIDSSQMKIKENLIKKTDVKLLNKIKCVIINLRKPEKILQNLKKHGWDDTKQTILVFEGISYFLSEKNFSEIISLFKTQNKTNHVLLEYLLPESKIHHKILYISQKIFELIHKNNNISYITRYDSVAINACLKDRNVTKKYTLKDMEKERLGKNLYFKSNNGWIEICYIPI